MDAHSALWLQGEVAMVAVAAEVWKAAPQKAAQAIDRLMALRLVSGTAIVNWVFGSHGVSQLDDELATGLAWEVFYNAVNKTLARAQVCQLVGLLKISEQYTSTPSGGQSQSSGFGEERAVMTCS